MNVFKRTATGPGVDWRTVECWGAGISIFFQTGALFPLLLASADGTLSDPAKAKLRLMCLPAYVFAIMIAVRNKKRIVVAIRRNLLLPTILALPFLSVLWSVGPSTTLRRAIGLLFTVLFAYALAIRFTPRQLLLILFVILGLCVVLSVAMLAISPDLARMPGDGAMRGIFINKNSLGWFACLMLLVATVVFFDATLGLRRAAVILLIAGAICLVGSGSMTAMIATGSVYLLIAFYLILQRTRGISRVVIILISLQLSVAALVLLHEFLVPLLETLGKDATLTGRVPLWELVDRQIADRLLFGYGYQSFWIEANPSAWAIWSQIRWQAPHAHNGFRDTMLSFGLCGTVLFIALLVRALYQGAILQCRDPYFGWIWMNVFTGVMLVMNLTESLFLVQNDAIFIIFATSVIMFSLHAPSVSMHPNPNRNVRIVEPGPELQA